LRQSKTLNDFFNPQTDDDNKGMYLWVCMYTGVQMSLYTCVYVSKYLDIYNFMYRCIYMYMYIHIYLYIYMYIHMYKIYIDVFVCMYYDSQHTYQCTDEKQSVITELDEEMSEGSIMSTVWRHIMR
jgi:hypothetical protein